MVASSASRKSLPTEPSGPRRSAEGMHPVRPAYTLRTLELHVQCARHAPLPFPQVNALMTDDTRSSDAQ